MDRKANLPAGNLGRPAIGGDANLNLNSSSSLSVSLPDFLSQLHAVFKRPRPLGTMQTFGRARRVLVSHGESSKSSVSTTSVTASGDRKLPQTIASRGAGRLLNVGSDQRKDGAVENRMNPQEDSLLNSPSIIGTVTNVQGNNMCPFGLQQQEAELHADRKKASLAASSSHLVSSNDDFKDQFSLGDNASLAFQSDR